MRETYHRQLDLLVEELADMSAMSRGALRDATRALLDRDLRLAERVISGDRQINQARSRCERHAHSLLALQAPVASDLRTILAASLAAEDLERMGDLARHVAELVRRRHPAPVLPEELRSAVAELHRRTADVAEAADRTIRTRDLTVARSTRALDDLVNRRHRELLGAVIGHEWRHGIPAAVDASLLCRYYERFADHAVALSVRMIYVITGKPPDGSNGGPHTTLAA